MSILADPVASAWLVYDYLAEEVFDRQEPDVQQFLTRTSVLNRMSAAACDYLLGSTSSRLALLALEERGLFTSSVDPARESFRYHQLFLEFLRQKLYQRESRETVEALHLGAAQFHETQEEWEECVHHYLKAGVPARAAEVVERIGNRQIFTGRSQTVEQWLRALPESVTATRPWVLALRGRMSQMSGRHQEAMLLLERALRLFAEEGDREGDAWAEGEIAYVQFLTGQLKEAVAHFVAAVARARDGRALKSDLLVVQSMAYRSAGMLEEAAKSCTASLKGLASVDDEFSRLWGRSRAYRNLAMAQMEMGNLEPARRIARETHALCVAQQIGEHEESWTLASLGAILWASGELEEAAQVFQRALSLSSRYTANQRQFMALWHGNSLRDSGRYLEAEESYAQGGPASRLESLLMAVATRGAHATRIAAADLCRQCLRSDSFIVRTTAELLTAAVLRGTQESIKALDHLREATGLLRSHGYRLRLASALLHQARLEYELKRPVEGMESLAEALRLAEAEGYHHFFWWDVEMVASLCYRALAEDLYPDYVSGLAMRRLDSASGILLAPLLQDRRPAVRQRAAAILSRLPQGGPVSLREELLAECGDQAVRRSLLQAVNDGTITAEGVRILRAKYGLSWREVEILVEYYLRPAVEPIYTGARLRTECARRLSISENTVRCHVNSLRSKLALPSWMSGKRVLDWAAREGLLPIPAAPPLERIPGAEITP